MIWSVRCLQHGYASCACTRPGAGQPDENPRSQVSILVFSAGSLLLVLIYYVYHGFTACWCFLHDYMRGVLRKHQIGLLHLWIAEHYMWAINYESMMEVCSTLHCWNQLPGHNARSQWLSTQRYQRDAYLTYMDHAWLGVSDVSGTSCVTSFLPVHIANIYYVKTMPVIWWAM